MRKDPHRRSVPFEFYKAFLKDWEAGKHHFLGGDQLAVALTNRSPLATKDSLYKEIEELPAFHGYPLGGFFLKNRYGKSSTVYSQSGESFELYATNGKVGPFRYAVLYNRSRKDPPNPLVGWWDWGSPLTLLPGENFRFVPADPFLVIR